MHTPHGEVLSVLGRYLKESDGAVEVQEERVERVRGEG